MRRLSLLLILLMIGAVSAQTGVSKPRIGQMQAGTPALLFSFRGLDFLSLNSFDGGIGAKYFFTPTIAFRGHLQTTIANQTLPVQLDTGQTGKDGKISGSIFEIGAAVEAHLSSSRLQPFIGAGGSFSTTSTEAKTPVIDPGLQLTVKNDLNGEQVNGRSFVAATAFSIYGLLGFEFFVMRNISLAGEYQLNYSKSSRKDQEASLGDNSQTLKGGSVSNFTTASQGLLTLAVYFR